MSHRHQLSSPSSSSPKQSMKQSWTMMLTTFLILVVASYLPCGVHSFVLRTPAPPGLGQGRSAPRLTSAPGSTSTPPRATASSLFMSDSGPAVLDAPTIEKEDTTDAIQDKQDQKSGGWAVRLYNDPWNKREFVARCLMEVAGLSDGTAYQIMMQAHQNGISTIGQYNHERAEHVFKQLKEEGLTVDMIPTDEE